MSFWNTNDSQSVDTGGNFDGGGGQIEPIPDDTGCIAQIEEVSWSEFGDDTFINIKWGVLKPQEYANRKVFQKVRVFDAKPEKADKAKRMLHAIDKNCGGKLAASGDTPDDAALMSALCGNMMAIKVMEWHITAEQSNDGQERRGNWIRAVQPKGGKSQQAPAQQQQQAPAQQQAPEPPPAGPEMGDGPDDEIPF